MLGLILFIYTSAVQGELFCTRKRETLVGACGDSVFLPCNFSYEGFPSLTNLDLVWQLKRPGEFAVVHHEDMKGPPNLQQDSRFRNRTSVMDSWPQSRDITLTLSNISGADQGAYTCEIFTLTPYSRKICAEIQLNVHTDAVGLGHGVSVTAPVGGSAHLPCLSRPGCSRSSSHRPQTSWRFSKAGTALEAELVSSSHPPTDAGRNRISLSENGTLTLQMLVAADAGVYSCHRAGQGKMAEITLGVTADIRKIRYSAVQLVAFFLIPVGVALLFSAGLTLGVRRYKKRLQRKAQEERAWRDATAMPRKPLRSNENVDLTCTSISSVKPLLHSHLADPV
ncbi:uncharacterized protein LOC115078402 isoform X1 [Rhinatrema bivittatum]|uniref:uncharacterized protein LOC115078402 isoform X1 n=1 Tax=Rhinatrema bivittatum TaxID=194408 RepID=UPI00112ACBF1|nr:uncharacterized protein LOC115078402 isoform X1 [Rhinatrema bivittatum]XP_029437172.1 uncharacterized protein LOC115078402 isoform X1 [Rhinatrema bivittatum]XP_029437173.1 uncharacterized protein LOC115078402 isoform X1 [Rhinatrema bivittatum]XP_029437174.1 uncharacterized protein LOC115078402 isoform X1 [Rhinatrema bivittatum]